MLYFYRNEQKYFAHVVFIKTKVYSLSNACDDTLVSFIYGFICLFIVPRWLDPSTWWTGHCSRAAPLLATFLVPPGDLTASGRCQVQAHLWNIPGTAKNIIELW